MDSREKLLKKANTRSHKKHQKTEQQIIENIQQLQKNIFNQDISSISSINQDYFPSKKAKVQISQKQIIEGKQQQMVLVSKKNLLKLFSQIKLLKKTIKSQSKRIKNQIQSIRNGAQEVNTEKILLMRQQEYLKDMQRSASQGKIKFYKSDSNFYKNTNKL